jgi:nitrite reductase/ring-hydroxylating ferredoxin subunit
MSHFVKLTTTSELPPEGEAREFELDGKTYCIAHTMDGLAAVDNVCVHRGGPLGQGVLDGNKIVCPWHGWSFDMNTGASVHNASVRVATYPIQIEGEAVLIGLDD